jgi:hypothetical protein
MKILFLLLALVVGVGAQTQMPGNPDCSSLGFNSEYKVEPPNAGTYTVAGIGTVTFTRNTPQTLSWTSSNPAFVRAVIMKAGNGANIYLYNPAISGGDMLSTGVQQELSHVSFCFNRAPTAASVNVSGQVLDFYGRPVYQARVSITNASTGEVKSAISNPFGYYQIQGLEVGNFYQIQATAKRYQFLPQSFTLNDELTGLIIQALY